MEKENLKSSEKSYISMDENTNVLDVDGDALSEMEDDEGFLIAEELDEPDSEIIVAEILRSLESVDVEEPTKEGQAPKKEFLTAVEAFDGEIGNAEEGLELGLSEEEAKLLSNNESKEESKEETPSPPKRKLKLSIPKVKPTTFLISVIVLIVVGSTVLNSPIIASLFSDGEDESSTEAIKLPADQEISIKIPTNSKGSAEEIEEFTTILESFLNIENEVNALRTEEYRIYAAFLKGDYTESQTRNFFAQSAAIKNNHLKVIEKMRVSTPFETIKTLAERFVRSDLNMSKRVNSDFLNSIKPNESFNTMSTQMSSVEQHDINFIDEVERLLKKYGISYSRKNNKITFE